MPRRTYTVQRRSREQLSVRRVNVDGRELDEENFLNYLQSLLFHDSRTQSALAEHANLCPATIANLVYAKTREPRATTLLKLMRAKGIRLEAHIG